VATGSTGSTGVLLAYVHLETEGRDIISISFLREDSAMIERSTVIRDLLKWSAVQKYESVDHLTFIQRYVLHGSQSYK